MIEAAVIATPAAQAEAADLVGRWEGALRVGEVSIPLVVRVAPGPDGLHAVMDSPAQNATDIPVADLSETSGVVRFTIAAIGGRFEGVRSPDGSTWTGAWNQGGSALPLILTRTAEVAGTAAPVPMPAPAPPERPQTPVPPFPYAAETVTIPNAGAGITLAGTLTLPQGAGPFPAVVLLTGSGAQDRDETIMGHKPFAVWADALTQRGVAVLRYDDRGVGGSGGGSIDETTADFATDAAAAVAWLGARPEIDPARIGLMGHSEGATTAQIAVAGGAPAAFVVMIAGPAVSGAEILTEQASRIASAVGATPEQAARSREMQGRLMQAVALNKDDAAAVAREVEAVLDATGQTSPQARAAIPVMSSGWYRYFVGHDPASDLAAMRVPMLALYGDKDLNVPADQNGEALARLKPDAEIVVLPGLNHLMQHAETGLPTEYATITETLAPEAIETVTDWVVRVTGAH